MLSAPTYERYIGFYFGKALDLVECLSDSLRELIDKVDLEDTYEIAKLQMLCEISLKAMKAAEAVVDTIMNTKTKEVHSWAEFEAQRDAEFGIVMAIPEFNLK